MNPTYPLHRSLRQIRGCAPAAVDKSACVVPPPAFALRLIAIMAQRVAPSRHQADNPSGSTVAFDTPAARNDWHDVRRFHVGTDHYESTQDAGYTTARASVLSKTKINFFAFWGSPYTTG
jgi:hypothetical protein